MGSVSQAASSNFGREPALTGTELPPALHGPPTPLLPQPAAQDSGSPASWSQAPVLGPAHTAAGPNQWCLFLWTLQEPPPVSHVLAQWLCCVPVFRHGLFICWRAGAKPGGGQLEPLQRGELQLPLLRGSPPALDAREQPFCLCLQFSTCGGGWLVESSRQACFC